MHGLCQEHLDSVVWPRLQTRDLMMSWDTLMPGALLSSGAPQSLRPWTAAGQAGQGTLQPTRLYTTYNRIPLDDR